MKFYYNIPFWFSCTNIVNSLSLKIEEKPEGNRTRTHLTSGRPLPIFNPSHFTNQPYIKMLFVLFWSYRLISYELNNSSYCACIIQVVVVSETDMVFFYLQWNKTAGKQQKIIIVLECVKTCGRRVNLVYIFHFLTLEFTQFTVSPELVLKSIHVMWGRGWGSPHWGLCLWK